MRWALQKAGGWEGLSLLYLGLPTLLFFAFFVRPVLAWPAIVVLAFFGYRVAIGQRRPTSPLSTGHWVGLATLSCAWVFAAGGLGLFQRGSDWAKHYALLNLLAEQQWPPELSEGVLRYPLGFYLVPALASKLLGGRGMDLFVAAWMVAGLLLVFRLAARWFATPKAAVFGAVCFALFGGWDGLGTWLTGDRHGPRFHLEWWASWIEYPSHATALFWVPQHALPSWIGLLLLLQWMEQEGGEVAFAPMLLFVGFWSPFAAFGLLPFVALLVVRKGPFATLFTWQMLATALLLALPVSLYLGADSAAIPKGPIWREGCLMPDEGCFSIASWLLFLALEVGAPALVLFVCRGAIQKDVAAVAIASLCVIPLYRVGIANDFGMRVCIPALAVLAWGCARAATSSEYAGARRAFAACVLCLGLAGPVGELCRGLWSPPADYRHLPLATAFEEKFVGQYFAKSRIAVLRQRQ